MLPSENISTQPLFLLFIALSILLVVGYLWGRRKNREIYQSSFHDLVELLEPADQTFTNIGGAIGYHANLTAGKKSFLSHVELTITLLPRHAWLYFPISLLIRRWDRLFITLHLKKRPPAEGHLIDARYAAFRGPRIANAQKMSREDVRWGGARFILYYTNANTRRHFMNLLERTKDCGEIKHIAILPHQKRCFVFMIPKKARVGASFAPIYQWLPSTVHANNH